MPEYHVLGCKGNHGTDNCICANCGHYNAMLHKLGGSVSEWKCRDCGFEVKTIDGQARLTAVGKFPR